MVGAPNKTQIGTGPGPWLAIGTTLVSKAFGKLKTRVQRLARLFGLSLLIVGASEALITLDMDRRLPASVGYLVKSGNEYLVAWRTHDDNQLRAYRFVTLSEALDHARRLKLRPGRTQPSIRFQRLWLKKTASAVEMHWKTPRSPQPNRLTFRNAVDAKYFFDSFEFGAYTFSPFGHAILLLPRR